MAILYFIEGAAHARQLLNFDQGQEDAATLRDYGNAFKNEILVGRKIRVDYKIDFYPYGMMSTGSRGTLDERYVKLHHGARHETWFILI